MKVRGNSWRARLATTVVVAASVGAAFWLGAGARAAAESPAPVIVLLAGVMIAAIAAMTAIHTRRIRRLLLLVSQTARKLSSGDSTARLEYDGTPELDSLARAMERVRERLTSQLRGMDYQRQTVAALLDQLREGVVVVDPDGRVAIINPAAVELLDLAAARQPAGYAGMAIEQCFPQMDIQRLLAPAPRRGAAALSLDAARTETQLEIESAAGTRHLLAHASAILLPASDAAAEGVPQRGRLLVVTDITDLARGIRMKTDFVTNASHELRTPLATIRAAVETLQQEQALGEASAAKRWIDVIQRQSDRLILLASDLADLARVESPLARFQPRRLDAGEFIDEVRAHFAEKVSARGVRLAADMREHERTSFVADPQLLRLVIDNLVDNAIKFSDAGKEVRIAIRAEAEVLTISVIDQGCGIPPDEQERVFERFYQVERARGGGERGSGLGLSIVRHAVATMDGEVRLESTVGRGTTVTVTLPQYGLAAVA